MELRDLGVLCVENQKESTMSRRKGTGSDMMGQLKKMQEQLEQAQSELEHETVEVTTGGGSVRIVMSGTQECQQVTIDPKVVEQGEVELLQDMVLLAINQAIHESQVLAARRLGPLAGGFGPEGPG